MIFTPFRRWLSDDTEFDAPFVNVTYGDHPAAPRASGAALADVLVKFMTGVMGFSLEQIQAGILGGAFDGAYLGSGGLSPQCKCNLFSVLSAFERT